MSSPFPKNIPLCEPFLSGKEWLYVKECMDSGWISNSGPFIGRFEKAVADYTNTPFSVGVANGTSGLHLSLLACGVKPGDMVLVPALTFISPVNTIRYSQAFPVFMDIDPATLQIDVEKVARFLVEECRLSNDICVHKKSGKQVSAILAVHLLGFSCAVDALAALAKTYRLALIEDAAEGLGVRYKGRHVGTFGDVGVLSFNGNKIVTAGGAGMLLTADAAHADKIRYWSTQAKDNPDNFYHSEVGFNYRISHLHAAVGLAQMERVNDHIAKKRKIAAYYDAALKGVPDLRKIEPIVGCEATFWLYTVLLNGNGASLKRDKILKKMSEESIMARPLFHPIHQLPPYRNETVYQMEHTVDVYERGICLPSSVGLEESDLQRVMDVLKKSCAC
ncbi:MAG: LegC family aminotransferase [Deltaproteobacteria bacterium]|nr:LegC family aminotransferase [Deltaproteobacteria bacterium]